MSLNNLHIHELPTPENFPGEVLESLHINQAEEAVRSGETIPPAAYTKDDQHIFSLKPQPQKQAAGRATDELLTLLIARGLERTSEFTLALKQDGFASGPYLNVRKENDLIEATLFSNYRKLEPKEGWLSAILSLFEWTNIDTGVLTTKLYRKVWPTHFPDLEIASSISEVMTYVLNANRGGGFWVLTTLGNEDELLQALPMNISWIVPAFDSSFAARVTQETRERGMIPEPTTRSVDGERTLGIESVSHARFLAEQADDELGMMSLEKIKVDLEFRSNYLESMLNEVSTALKSI